jgi:methylated-DNA-[protein]-cysteine S-methyltransferase
MSVAPGRDLIVYSLDKTAEILEAVFVTELGWMAVAVGEQTLRGLVFGYSSESKAEAALVRALKMKVAPAERRKLGEVHAGSLFIDRLSNELKRFAAGEPVDFSRIVIDESHLTTFGRRIVAACRRIPYGQTRSYGQLAAICGSPGAARAVGHVMAKNRYPLVVPCHRVLAAGGTIGGYSAPDGITMKRRLLALEGSWV